MTIIEKDELLKKRIMLLAEKSGGIVVSAYDGDITHKNRRNTKRARRLEAIIQENELPYCKFKDVKSYGETAWYFVVFGNTEDSKIKIFQQIQSFRVLKFYEDILAAMEGKEFIHPETKEAAQDFQRRYELCLSDEELNLPLKYIGEWSYEKLTENGSYLYRNGQLLCSLRQPDEQNKEYIISIGTIVPIGALMKRMTASTLAEAIEYMKKWRDKDLYNL